MNTTTQTNIIPPPADQAEVDPNSIAADPQVDRPHRCRPKGKVDRLLKLLDSLETEEQTHNRRWRK